MEQDFLKRCDDGEIRPVNLIERNAQGRLRPLHPPVAAPSADTRPLLTYYMCYVATLMTPSRWTRAGEGRRRMDADDGREEEEEEDGRWKLIGLGAGAS